MRTTPILTTALMLGGASMATAHDVCGELSAPTVRGTASAAHQITGTALYAAPGVHAMLAESDQRGALFVKVLEFMGMRHDPQQNVSVPEFRELLVPVAPPPGAPAGTRGTPSH